MSQRVFSLGHSPDPDDAFMFYGLAEGRVDTFGLRFEHILQDIETLNRRAMAEELDVTAVSLHAYAYLQDRYALLAHGASMGDRYGPLVVAREPVDPFRLGSRLVGVPGTLTTAFLCLRLAVGPFRFTVLPFDRILDAVASGAVDAGLIIHEGQLTHGKQGLHPVLDLGVWWAERTNGLPLPLGGNAVRRALGAETIQRIAGILEASIRYGLDHREDALPHALKYGRDLDLGLTERFVGMYVNDYTLNYGERGRRAVRLLLEEAFHAGLAPGPVRVDFVG
jgi:1,4-dihydroxy-6-naphthoate synthase